jgi:hypothetical protein
MSLVSENFSVATNQYTPATMIARISTVTSSLFSQRLFVVAIAII